MIMFSLTGCYIGPVFYFDAKDLSKEIREIEFVYYENKYPSRMIVDENNTPIFNYGFCDSLEVLDKSLIDDFINDLANIKFHKLNRISNAPVGYTILLRQFNYDFIVLSCAVIDHIEYSFVAKFKAYGDGFMENYAMFKTHKDFDKLAKKYFASFK